MLVVGGNCQKSKREVNHTYVNKNLFNEFQGGLSSLNNYQEAQLFLSPSEIKQQMPL